MSYAKKHHGLSVKDYKYLNKYKCSCLFWKSRLNYVNSNNPDNTILIKRMKIALAASLYKVHQIGYYFERKTRGYRRNRNINESRTMPAGNDLGSLRKTYII
jgi:hypothetical protein